MDQRLGTVEELRHLTTEAHRLGMYVIIDAWKAQTPGGLRLTMVERCVFFDIYSTNALTKGSTVSIFFLTNL